MIFDALLCAFTVWFAFGLRVDQWTPLVGNQWWVVLISIGLSFPIFISFGLYRAIFRYVGSAALISMARAFAIYTFLFFCIYTLIGMNGVPRSIGVIQPLLLFVGAAGSRYFMRIWLGDVSHPKKSHRTGQSIALIYGAGSAGRQLAAALFANKDIKIKGYIDDDFRLQGNTINGVRVYSSENLLDLIKRLGVTTVLLAMPSLKQIRRNEIISSLYGCGVRVQTLPGMLDMAHGRIKVSDVHDLDMNDLLGREAVSPSVELLEKNIRNKVVLVTGAGGSIGSELCRQIIKFSPTSLVLLDSSEHALYLVYEELKKANFLDHGDGGAIQSRTDIPIDLIAGVPIEIIPCLASVRDEDLIHKIFKTHLPETVFHAAAYKHVPLVEQNPAEGIRNNVFGTLNCAKASVDAKVSNFILISTDKAVRPTNVMGASKRIAELILQSMADTGSWGYHSTQFSIVRFGNVLGSSGSVAPLFSAQIKSGGPITLTHTEVTRYFMTIPEAAQLVIQSSAMATGGDVFVLDMGQPVRIFDLAVKMIHLSGLMVRDQLHPYGDIEIKVTGLRPGEKLYEELLIGDNPQPTAHPKIMKAHEEFLPWETLKTELDELKHSLEVHDGKLIREFLRRLVPSYQSNRDI